MRTTKIKLKNRIKQFQIFEIKLMELHLKQQKIIMVSGELLDNKVK